MGQTAPACPAGTAFPAEPERLFLMAVRRWVLGYRSDQDPMPRLFREFEHAGVRDAVYSLNGFMAVVADTAQQSIAVHAPQCLDLSDDELSLLAAAWHVQMAEGLQAERTLSVMLLSGSGAATALRPLEDLVRLFAEAGLRFGRRNTAGGQSEAATVTVSAALSVH